MYPKLIALLIILPAVLRAAEEPRMPVAKDGAREMVVEKELPLLRLDGRPEEFAASVTLVAGRDTHVQIPIRNYVTGTPVSGEAVIEGRLNGKLDSDGLRFCAPPDNRNESKTMKPTLTFLMALLFAPLASLSLRGAAVEPKPAQNGSAKLFPGFNWDRVPVNIHFGKRSLLMPQLTFGRPIP